MFTVGLTTKFNCMTIDLAKLNIIVGANRPVFVLAQARFFAVIVKNLSSTKSDPKHVLM